MHYLSAAVSCASNYPVASSVIGGVVAGKLLCKTVCCLTKSSAPLACLERITPQFVSRFLTQGPLPTKLKRISLYAMLVVLRGNDSNSRLGLYAQQLYSAFGAPIVEETLFRGMHALMKVGLTACGVPEIAARVASAAFSTLLFATAHGNKLGSVQTVNLFMQGATFAAAFEMQGNIFTSFVTAILTHSLNNVVLHQSELLQAVQMLIYRPIMNRLTQ